MWIKEGELLHSFIFRRLLSFNSSQKKLFVSQIITNGFFWKTFPKINPDWIWAFHEYSFAELYKLTTHHTQIRYCKSLAPVESLLHLTGSIFLDDAFRFNLKQIEINEDYDLRKEIKYCSACFQEQLAADGFPWIKLEWTIDRRCRIHNSELTSYSCSCPETSLKRTEKFESILRGKCLTCGESTWPVSSVLVDSEDDQSELLEPHFSPCFIVLVNHEIALQRKRIELAADYVEFEQLSNKFPFAQYILDEFLEERPYLKPARVISDKVRKLAQLKFSFPKANIDNGIHPSRSVSTWYLKFKKYENLMPEESSNFLNLKAEVISVEMYTHGEKIKEQILVSKNRNCLSCSINPHSCPNFPVIVRGDVDWESYL